MVSEAIEGIEEGCLPVADFDTLVARGRGKGTRAWGFGCPFEAWRCC